MGQARSQRQGNMIVFILYLPVVEERMSQMGCSEVVQFCTFHKVRTKWILVDLVQEEDLVVVEEASKQELKFKHNIKL